MEASSPCILPLLLIHIDASNLPVGFVQLLQPTLGLQIACFERFGNVLTVQIRPIASHTPAKGHVQYQAHISKVRSSTIVYIRWESAIWMDLASHAIPRLIHRPSEWRGQGFQEL
jgi:hypothetical protein